MKNLIKIMLLICIFSGGLFAENKKVEISIKGNELLKIIDRNLLPESVVFYRKLINIEPDGTKKSFVLFTAKKGKEKSLSTFLQPKTEIGRHTLRIGDNMWLYIPNVGRAIRITSLQSVTGGLFNNSDIMRLDYSEEYNCIEYNKNKLILKAKNGNVAYDKLIMNIDSKTKLPLKIECFTASDMLVKTLYFKKNKDFGNGIVRPSVIETDSPMYKDYKSIMIYAKLQKKSFKDEIFTVDSMNKINDLR